MTFPNGTRVHWISNTGRVRIASIITKMKVTVRDDHLLRVMGGPSLVGDVLVIPACRLSVVDTTS